jgi:hypothetical protein
MKNIGLVVLILSILSFTSSSANKSKVIRDIHHATCRGSANCNACSSCNYCGHCNSGGSCGVCSSGKVSTLRTYSTPKAVNNNVSSSQCQGITKKGNRCKRMVKGGGYCWQHK